MLLLLCFLLLWQQDLPTYGKLELIKDLTRVYVASHNEDSRKRIIKSLSKDKRLQEVNSPDDAEFFIEYEELSREALAGSGHTRERQQRSQMRVYLLDKEQRKTIVWSDTRARDTEHFLGMKMFDTGRNESELTKKFLKDLKKVRG